MLKNYKKPTALFTVFSTDVLLVSDYSLFDVIAKDFDWSNGGGA